MELNSVYRELVYNLRRTKVSRAIVTRTTLFSRGWFVMYPSTFTIISHSFSSHRQTALAVLPLLRDQLCNIGRTFFPHNFLYQLKPPQNILTLRKGYDSATPVDKKSSRNRTCSFAVCNIFRRLFSALDKSYFLAIKLPLWQVNPSQKYNNNN